MNPFVNQLIHESNNQSTSCSINLWLNDLTINWSWIIQLIYQSSYCSVNWSTHQPIDQWIHQLFNQLLNGPINWTMHQSIDQHINSLISRSINWSMMNQSMDPFTNQLVNHVNNQLLNGPINWWFDQMTTHLLSRSINGQLLHEAIIWLIISLPINSYMNQSIGPSFLSIYQSNDQRINQLFQLINQVINCSINWLNCQSIVQWIDQLVHWSIDQ